MTDDDLADILARTSCLLLDFDGPVCSVFAGRPAAQVADRLRRLVSAHGYPITGDVAASQDPFDVLRYAAGLNVDLARQVDDAFRVEEVTAVDTAEPTPATTAVMSAARLSGRSVAVVSNNSAVAVARYLRRQGMNGLVDTIAARTNSDVKLLKPNPYLVGLAIDSLDADPGRAAFIGDSVSDVEAGTAAGVHSIGYANKPGKAGRLSAAGAACVIDSMQLVADRLAQTPALGSCHGSIDHG